MTPTVVVAGTVLLGHLVTTTFSADEPPVRLATRQRAFVGGPGAVSAVAASRARVTASLVALVGDDDAGQVCVARLAAAGVDVSGVEARAGWITGRSTVVVEPEATAGAEGLSRVVTLAQPRQGVRGASPDRTRAKAALERCRPGDVLLVDALSCDSLLIDEAYERDLQIVADLYPFPRFGSVGWPDASDLQRVDVAVVDEAGAGLLAESGVVVGSVVVLLGTADAPGSGGASWDGEVVRHRPGRDVGGVLFGLDDGAGVARSAFCGRLAAALASGEDRPEALDAALDGWCAVAESGSDAVFPGRGLDGSADGAFDLTGLGERGDGFTS